jgi:hypothetical protein
MEGVGRGAGEPPEAAWSHIGPYGYILQYMSLPARQASMEKIAANWNSAKLESLPALLGRMYVRAAAAADRSFVAMAELTTYAKANGIQEAEVSFSQQIRHNHARTEISYLPCMQFVDQKLF